MANYTQATVTQLTKDFARLDPKQLSRNQGFGILLNCVGSNGKSMKDQFGLETALKLASEVLDNLGFTSQGKTSAW